MGEANGSASAAMDGFVRYELVGAVALVTVDRPARCNAWCADVAQAVVAAIQRANAAAEVGAIVLTATGSSYCGGADLKAEPRYDAASGRRVTPATYLMGKGERNWISLLADSKPVIIALNGPAVGIGATHILAADIRIAAESASIAFPFLRLGAMPECGSTALLPRLVGAGRALDLVLRNATVSAEEALRIGLVTAVYPDDRLREEALALGEQLARLPPLQLRLTRRMFRENAGNVDADAVMQVENRAFLELLKTLRRDKPLPDRD